MLSSLKSAVSNKKAADEAAKQAEEAQAAREAEEAQAAREDAEGDANTPNEQSMPRTVEISEEIYVILAEKFPGLRPAAAVNLCCLKFLLSEEDITDDQFDGCVKSE
jgi:hypothetical protein